MAVSETTELESVTSYLDLLVMRENDNRLPRKPLDRLESFDSKFKFLPWNIQSSP